MVNVDAATTWGSTPEEREREYPCDAYLGDAQVVCWRAIAVDASPATLFRRLCQLRVAPYSYDWIDNLGRRSPRELTPGLEHLAIGQRFMTIFELVEFEEGRSITLAMRGASAVFGDVVITYLVEPVVEGRVPAASRLVAKLRWAIPGLRGRLLARPAAAADLIMMRRQFRNLARLAEADERSTRGSRAWHPPRTSLLPPPRP